MGRYEGRMPLGSMRSMKAQSIALDFIAGSAVMLLIIVYYVILWSNLSERYYSLFTKDEIDTSLLAVSDALVISPGYPVNWTSAPADAQLIGLAKSPNVLDADKVNAFFAMPYDDAKLALGLRRDFFIDLKTPLGDIYGSMGEYRDSKVVSEITRLALLNNQTVWLRMRIYGE